MYCLAIFLLLSSPARAQESSGVPVMNVAYRILDALPSLTKKQKEIFRCIELVQSNIEDGDADECIEVKVDQEWPSVYCSSLDVTAGTTLKDGEFKVWSDQLTWGSYQCTIDSQVISKVSGPKAQALWDAMRPFSSVEVVGNSTRQRMTKVAIHLDFSGLYEQAGFERITLKAANEVSVE